MQQHNEKEIADNLADIRLWTALSAILSVPAIIIPEIGGLIFLKAISMLLWLGFMSRSYWGLITYYSLKTTGKKWFLLQIVYSLSPVILMGSYLFYRPLFDETLTGIFEHKFNIPIFFIIAYLSWCAGDMVNRKYPCRAFVGAAAVFFVLLVGGQHGVWFGDDINYSDPTAESRAATGYFGWLFLIYIAISYTIMLARHIRDIRNGY